MQTIVGKLVPSVKESLSKKGEERETTNNRERERAREKG